MSRRVPSSVLVLKKKSKSPVARHVSVYRTKKKKTKYTRLLLLLLLFITH